MSGEQERRDGLRRLTELVARLRGPGGCPWDREQRLEDLRAYLVEEAHEVAAAIDAGDVKEIGDELGDLLFMTAFVGELAREAGGPALDEIVERAEAKMIARHPHVFGDVRLDDAAAVRRFWEERKAEESAGGRSLLDGVPGSLPALVGAYRLTQKAAGVGFDWPDAAAVLDKIAEELAELRAALAPAGGEAPAPIEAPIEAPAEASAEARAETGDLLFSVANLARHLGIDPEAALARTNRKFRRRFARLERELDAAGRSPAEASLEELDALWERAKQSESEDG